jgi:ectoine hydroxylase-related dioxygenase (phytanoyl-CoA dioxygenase family)
MTSLQVPETDPMHEHTQRIPLRKGEMVIWNTAQAHANFANYSNKLRLIQFVRMMPGFHCQILYSDKRQRKEKVPCVTIWHQDWFLKSFMR